jgi:hypothetical protein
MEFRVRDDRPPAQARVSQRGQPLGPGASSGVAEPAYRRKVAVSVGPLARLVSKASALKAGRRPYAERTYLRHAGSAKSRARAVVLVFASASSSASAKGRANASARSVSSGGRGGHCVATVSTLSTQPSHSLTCPQRARPQRAEHTFHRQARAFSRSHFRAYVCPYAKSE